MSRKTCSEADAHLIHLGASVFFIGRVIGMLAEHLKSVIEHPSTRHDLSSGVLVSERGEHLSYITVVAKTFRFLPAILSAETVLKQMHIAAIRSESYSR